MNEKDFKEDTQKHIDRVGHFIAIIIYELQKRISVHDYSKLEEPELSIFIKNIFKIKKTKYGTEEYTQCLRDMAPALEHHYKVNRHHPEHFEYNDDRDIDSISKMNLIDLIEMFCDWLAASERTLEGDYNKSIEIGCGRFEVDSQIKHIFENTLEFIKKNAS